MNKKTSSKDRGILVLPEDNENFKNERQGTTSSTGSKSIYEGFEYSHEFGQQKPMFFSREHNNFPLHGHYRGASAFICCSGPSFKDIVDNHKDKLDRVFTMSTNNSIKSYRTDAWISVDDPCRFLKSCWLDPKIMKFVPGASSEKKIWDSYIDKESDIKVGECPNMYYFRRNNKFNENRWMGESSFNWGDHQDHGGGRTVMLPAIKILYVMGFRKIYLLGCDFNMDANQKYHFEEERSKGAINCNQNTYHKMNNVYFPKLKKKFKEHGLEVYNCNPNSRLDVFPHKSFEDAYQDSVSQLGDIVNEPTMGMYKSPDVKKADSKSNASKVRDLAKIDKEREDKEVLAKDKKKKSRTVTSVSKNKKSTHCYKHFEDGNKERIKYEEWKTLSEKFV